MFSPENISVVSSLKGRCRPLLFKMYTRLAACARYAPDAPGREGPVAGSLLPHILSRSPGPRACGSFGLLLIPPDCAADANQVSRFSCMMFPDVRGSPTAQGQYPACLCPCLRFAASLTCLSVQNSESSGSLVLSCKTLSFSTSCRFIAALNEPKFTHNRNRWSSLFDFKKSPISTRNPPEPFKHR